MTILLSKNECNMKYETNKKKGGGSTITNERQWSIGMADLQSQNGYNIKYVMKDTW